MIMANCSYSYVYQFDGDDGYGFASPANDDEPVDLVSLFNTIGEKSRGDHSEVAKTRVCVSLNSFYAMYPVQNRPADPSSTTIPCSELASHGANEHSETHNGSLAFPLLCYSEASTSRTFCSSDSSATDKQTFNFGYEKLESEFHPDVFPAHVSSWLATHGGTDTQDFMSFSQHAIKETYLERDNRNDAFGFTIISNDNHQLMDNYEITDEIFDDSVGNSLLEASDNMESQFMDLSVYPDILHDEFCIPSITSINEPFCFGSNDTYGMFFDNKIESEEHLVHNISINSVMNYETVSERPYISAEGSKTFLASGESCLGEAAEVSKNGFHRCNMAKRTQVVVNNEKHGTHVPNGNSLVSAQKTSAKMRKNAKLKKNDEKSAHPAPLQLQETSLKDGGLTVPLLKHQRIALSWMTKKETKSRHCCGGILADDQGLGKTISAIALILKERSPPLSTETKEKQRETLNLDDEEEDAILHTNNTKTSLAAGTLVVCPTSVLRQWNEELQNKVTNESNLSVLVYHGVNRTKDPIEVAKYDVVLTTYAIVSMEVPKQPLVEEDDRQTQTKLSPNKKRKYPPTTSVESSNSELINRPLAKLRWFRVILDEAQSIKNYKTQVARACWGLRAKRRWCLSGTPIQNSIDDLYSYFRFLRYNPFSVFKSFCSQIKAPIQRNPVSGYKRLQLILKTIMLRRTKRTLVKGEPIICLPPKTITLKKVDFTEEERDFYRSLEAESRAQFAKYAAAGTVKQNYVNILLMLLRLRQACDHPLLVKDCIPTTNRRLCVEKAKELPSEKLNTLLNCLEASLAICGICNDPPEDAVVTSCEHVFCNQCILEHLSSDDNQCPSSDCKNLISKSSVFSKSTLEVSSGSLESEPCLRIEPTKALDSSKIKAALQVLQSISTPKGILGNAHVKEKAIVFSQWTRMLDLLEVCLKDSSIGYRRLDGTMSVVARDKAVKDFNTLPEVSVMIMSLKAASLGLNMVAACHVILLDLWWNPTTEDQAIDRAHRIGQTRPVTVLRLTVKDTVEDRILALQEKKRKMVASAFGDDDNGGSKTRLTVEDMRYLFQA
ncbi:unnamed protein product [Lactuca saligna]|uniref:Helicase-like transcription factor CHR28 n=1 Tax=Lactuca saligna TaxID=75948 RepID=A0AA36EE06_LACSI|nr:unnamed protein product [Lactuca saligna]